MEKKKFEMNRIKVLEQKIWSTLAVIESHKENEPGTWALIVWLR